MANCLGEGVTGQVIDKKGNPNLVTKVFYEADDFKKECNILNTLLKNIYENTADKLKHLQILQNYTLLNIDTASKYTTCDCESKIQEIDFIKCNGKTLSEYRKETHKTQVVPLEIYTSIRNAVLSVFSVLHHYRIYHCDMLTNNLMICESNGTVNCKVIDFGEAQDHSKIYRGEALHDIGKIGDDGATVDLERNDLVSLKFILNVCNDEKFIEENKVFPEWINDDNPNPKATYNSAITILDILNTKTGGYLGYAPTTRFTTRLINGVKHRKLWVNKQYPNIEFVKIKINSRFIFEKV